MPFVKEKFIVPQEIPAFLYIMRTFNCTQGEAQRLICKGRLLVDGKSMYKTGQKIKDEVEIVYFKPISKGIKPIFSNDDFMVFEKPSGVLVHPNTMATEYSMLDEIRAIAGDKANVTHRIDMETSGLLLASKHIKAERFLKSSFENKTISKSYLAWVKGKIVNEFSIDAPIAISNDYSKSKHKVYIDSSGKSALTHFKPLKYNAIKDITLLECYPKTGRTHQIRIHLFHMKHPIIGDPLYGTNYQVANDYLEGKLSPEDRIKYTGASRLMLHAYTLRFRYKNEFFIKSGNGLVVRA
jgi:23S rRNA pseudouridine1911/1915/1917 synthase